VFAFILESIGSTELLFILAIALIFFGPRKLPQLARSMGKGLSEFRKASDDFKRTWEREVALESTGFNEEPTIHGPQEPREEEDRNLPSQPQLEPADPELVVARESSPQAPVETAAEPVPAAVQTNQPEPLRKHEWL
jgi:TatA/E family protein of Tat protein translocase